MGSVVKKWRARRLAVIEDQAAQRRARRLLRAAGVEPDDPADIRGFLEFLKAELRTVAGNPTWPAWRRRATLAVVRDLAHAVQEVSAC